MLMFRLFPVLPMYEMQEIAEEQSENESKALPAESHDAE
jgi:hypothetical protein